MLLSNPQAITTQFSRELSSAVQYYKCFHSWTEIFCSIYSSNDWLLGLVAQHASVPDGLQTSVSSECVVSRNSLLSIIYSAEKLKNLIFAMGSDLFQVGTELYSAINELLICIVSQTVGRFDPNLSSVSDETLQSILQGEFNLTSLPSSEDLNHIISAVFLLRYFFSLIDFSETISSSNLLVWLDAALQACSSVHSTREFVRSLESNCARFISENDDGSKNVSLLMGHAENLNYFCDKCLVSVYESKFPIFINF